MAELANSFATCPSGRGLYSPGESTDLDIDLDKNDDTWTAMDADTWTSGADGVRFYVAVEAGLPGAASTFLIWQLTHPSTFLIWQLAHSSTFLMWQYGSNSPSSYGNS